MPSDTVVAVPDLSLGAGRLRFSLDEARAAVLTAADGLPLASFAPLMPPDGPAAVRSLNLRAVARPPYAYAEAGGVLGDGGFVNRRALRLAADIVVLADEFYAAAPAAGRLSARLAGPIVSGADGLRCATAAGMVRIAFAGAGFAVQADDAEVTVDLAASRFAGLFTVLALDAAGATEPLAVTRHPVTHLADGAVLPDRRIEALAVAKGDRCWTLVVAHEEYSSPNNSFLADDCTGFGEVVVFDRAASETVIGCTLVW
jgi:hypothetical protein